MSESTTKKNDTLQSSVLDNPQSDSNKEKSESPNHKAVMEARERAKPEAYDLLKTSAAINSKTFTDSAGVEWMERDSSSSSHQRYMRDMIFAEQKERQKYQHVNRNSSQNCQSSVDANSERSPARPFSCSTSTSLNDSVCSPVSDRSQSVQFDKVDRLSSATPESSSTQSSSGDQILPRASVAIHHESYLSGTNHQSYSQMQIDHEAMRQTMQYRAPSLMCEPSSAATAAAAASIFYNQLALQQQMQFIRHHQQQLVDSRCQLAVTVPVVDNCRFSTPIPCCWSGSSTSSGVVTNSRNAGVQSDHPNLDRDLH